MLAWIRKKLTPPPVTITALPEPKTEFDPVRLPTRDDQKVHLGVIIGHTRVAQGATMGLIAGGVSEYEYNTKVASLMISLAAKDYPRIKLSVITRDKQGILGSYKHAQEIGCDCVIELHFNASMNHKATGSETLCTPDPMDVEFSHIIHKKICDVFGRGGDSRGVVAIGRSVRGAPNIYAFQEGPNCLVEPFFGDSEDKLGKEKITQYAQGLLDAVSLWARKLDLIKG